MKNIAIILKKEFSRFFKDKRMVLSVFIPGLMIFLLYSIIGSAVSKMNQPVEGYKFTAYVVNMPEDTAMKAAFDAVLDVKEYDSVDSAKTAVTNGDLDLTIIFPDGFESNKGGELPPSIRIFYNGAEDNSLNGYNAMSMLLEAFKSPAFTVNEDGMGNIADDKSLSGKILSMIMPMLMFSLLASGCIAFAPESIAGEKERGTLSTILITPIKRWQLALGKIISLACFALLSGLSSFTGLILSLPKIMNGVVSGSTVTNYAAGDYFMLLGLIVSVVFIIISAFAIVSAFAKSVKEANSLTVPLMIVILLLGMFSMFNSSPALGLYAVPLLGSGIAFSSILMFNASPLGVVMAILSNLLVAAIFTVVLSFMFRSERIMFGR